jgi:hypothetical protein
MVPRESNRFNGLGTILTCKSKPIVNLASRSQNWPKNRMPCGLAMKLGRFSGWPAYAACFVHVGALLQPSPDALQPFSDESHGRQDDVDLHALESHVVRHGPHESLLPDDSDLSPHGSHLLAQELHRLMHVSLHGSHLL